MSARNTNTGGTVMRAMTPGWSAVHGLLIKHRALYPSPADLDVDETIAETGLDRDSAELSVMVGKMPDEDRDVIVDWFRRAGLRNQLQVIQGGAS